MSNPFDQFDTATNPFDQFDSMPLGAPAPVPQGQTPFFDRNYHQELMQLENRDLWRQPDDFVVYPNQSPERADNFDIGYGHKITPQEMQARMIHGIPFPGSISNAQAKEILRHDMATQWQGTRKALGPEFEKLPLGAQILLTDYNFTGVLDKFPKFTAAIMAGDYDTAEKEYIRYMTDAEGNKVPLGTRNTFAFKELQKLREGANVFDQFDSSPELPAESPDKVAASSSPDTGASSGEGSFLDRYIERIGIENLDPSGIGEATMGFLGGSAAFGAGMIPGISELIKSFAPGGVTPWEGLERMTDITRGFGEQYGYQPRGEKGREVLEKAMAPIMVPYNKAEEVVLENGGDEGDVKSVHGLMDLAFMFLPAAVKKGWSSGKTTVRERRAIKKVFEEQKKIVKEALPEGVKPDAIVKGMDEAYKEMRVQAGIRRKAPGEEPLTMNVSDEGLRGEALGTEMIPEMVEPGPIVTPVDRGSAVGSRMTPETMVPPLERAGLTGSILEPGMVQPEVGRNIVGSQMMPEQARNRLNRAEVWLRIQEAQKRRLRERYVGTHKEALVDEVNPYDFLEQVEQLEEVKGPSNAELATLEDIIKREQEIFEAGIEGSMPVSEKARMFAEWRANKAKVAENAMLKNSTKQPKSTVKPEDLGVSDRRNGIFENEQLAKEYAEANGYEGDIIVDPDSGRAFLDPDMMKAEEIVWDDPRGWEATEEVFYGEDPGGPDVRLSDEWNGDLFDVINNERGAVQVAGPKEAVVTTPEMTGKKAALDRTLIQQVKKLRKEADKIGKSLEDSLRSMGMDEDMIAGVLGVEERIPAMEARLRQADPITELIFNPPEESRIYQAYKGHGRGKNRVRVAKPPITQQIKDILQKAKIEASPTERGKLTKLMDSFEIRINTLDRISPELKKMVYDNWLAKEAAYKREYRRFRRALAKDVKQMTKRNRERISLFAHSMQDGGVDILKGMGFNEGQIPKFKDLSAFEQAMYQKYASILEDTWFRIDHMRSNTGLRPIGKLENYFPFIHKLREMHRGGVIQDLAGVEMTQFTGQSKKFKEKYFPYSKKRGKSTDPIELDIFDLSRDYMDKALKGIHVNPVAALAKEMAGMYVKGDKKAGVKGYRFEDKNPYAAKVLRDFADEIVGLDPVLESMNQKVRGFVNVLQAINKNLTIATLFGTASTAMKQPLALIGVMSETNPMFVIEGLMKAAVDDPTKLKATSKARAMSNVLEVRQMDIFMDQMSKDIAGGKIGRIRDRAAQYAAMPMTILDAFAAEAGFNAGYAFAKRKLKLSDAEAVRYADDIVARTQGVGVRGAVSPIQATAATKWMTLFQTFAINDFNYIARDLLGIRHPDSKNAKHVRKVLKYTAASVLANMAFEAMGEQAPKPSPFGTYNEMIGEGADPGEALAQAILEMTEFLPMVGGAMKFEGSLFGAFGEWAEKVPQSLNALLTSTLNWSAMSEKEKFYNAMLIGETLGKTFGVPMTNQLKKSIRTASRTDDPVKIILGTYVEEAEKQKAGNQYRSARTVRSVR